MKDGEVEDGIAGTQTASSFAEDWRGAKHRPLSDETRAEVVRYIDAICRHGTDRAVEAAVREGLWRKFRNSYDDLGGQNRRSDREDALKAMGRI